MSSSEVFSLAQNAGTVHTYEFRDESNIVYEREEPNRRDENQFIIPYMYVVLGQWYARAP